MIISLNGITKSFGELEVLRGISFECKSGEALGLLGRNGAGKTTLIRILMNVFRGGGEILVDGKPIDYTKISFGYLPEERGLYPKKRIIDQLIYFAELKGMKRSDATASIDYWLGRLGMSEYRDRRLDTLSKGNQQKIQLITAIAHDPDIVILDEPFSGLDPVNAKLLKDVVEEIIAKGKAVIFSSHQMNYIEEFCDSIVIIHKGEAVISGRLCEIKESYPKNKLVIHSPDAERILGEVEGASMLKDGGVMLTLDSPEDKRDTVRRLADLYDIDGIKVLLPSLNDIFVEYASEEEKK